MYLVKEQLFSKEWIIISKDVEFRKNPLEHVQN